MGGKDRVRIALVGQPNCGKSTIFNQVAGYKSIASNFPGTTVSYTMSDIRFGNRIFELIDLPGIYSLSPVDEAEKEARKFILKTGADLYINVVDASLLSRSLEFTIELMELELPMILCLNMMDEAVEKGMIIDVDKLSKVLGVPVVTTVANRGRGIKELFEAALRATEERVRAFPPRFCGAIEREVLELEGRLKGVDIIGKFPVRFIALKLIEGDEEISSIVYRYAPDIKVLVEKIRESIIREYNREPEEVIASQRHSLAFSIFEQVAKVKRGKETLKDRLDSLVLNPYVGYFLLFFTLYLFFTFVFKFGSLIEAPLLRFFEELHERLSFLFSSQSLFSYVLKGLYDGFTGGLAIVLPYLVPFLFGLSFLEDLGYLPRIAFLMDALMHKVGLHGKAILPLILGYGCNVPAVMAVRILESSRDRFIASILTVLVPCAARMTIIMGLVGFYLGGELVFLLYVLNLIVIGFLGWGISKLLPGYCEGLIMEVPPYRLPTLRGLLAKTWLRLREFIIIAWPLLIGGSIFLSLITYYGFENRINSYLSFVTYPLGLPTEVGITLIFGILRKELSLLMLRQALGGELSLLPSQMFIFTVFVVFYFPCVSTLGALIREIGLKRSFFVLLLTFVVAFSLAIIVRGASLLLLY
ncbi:MAG: ferrous iron transport protein B [Synergistetes bacterium]|nr:ferrous iron transport protein B [Synergistota bacterium]MCX8127555.1 ferrous iron transport protein B [Synergistota bacterium]MDW8191528.1 ferrous iron transport protein B [Synergistota bacterium]